VAFNVTVTALDTANNVAKSYAGTVHFSSTDGQAMLPADSTLMDGAGTFSVTLRSAGSQSVSATDTDTALIKGTSSPIEINPGPASHLAISAPTTAPLEVAFNFKVTALDVANNVALSYTGTVHFSSTDGQATLPPNSTLSNGVGVFPATLQTLGTQTITATDTVTASITGTSPSITVGPPPPAIHFSVSAPMAAESGSAFHITVAALSIAGETVSNYSGTVHFSSTDAQALLPGDSTLTNGIGSFTATLKSAGSQTISATDTVTPSFTGTSSPVNVGAGPANHFTVTAQTPVRSGTASSVIVTARDAANNVSSTYAGTVHFSSTDVQASLPGDSTLTDGMGAFMATLRTTGAQRMTATDTVTATITGTSNVIEVFFSCQTKGEECYLNHVCCPGLTCVALGDRNYCENF
jgi:hypothetical protein